DLRPFGVNITDETLRDDLHLKRVHAEYERGELVNRSLDGFTEIVQRAFADAVYAFVGRDFRKEPILPGIPGNVGIDGSDAHRKRHGTTGENRPPPANGHQRTQVLARRSYPPTISKPDCVAAAESLSSLQTNSLPIGLCLHQTRAADSCSASEARTRN